MQIVKNKTITLVITLLLAVSMVIAIVPLPSATAHTPAWQIPTYAFVVVAPSPVGVG
jgi:hypothetical protein